MILCLMYKISKYVTERRAEDFHTNTMQSGLVLPTSLTGCHLRSSLLAKANTYNLHTGNQGPHAVLMYAAMEESV